MKKLFLLNLIPQFGAVTFLKNAMFVILCGFSYFSLAVAKAESTQYIHSIEVPAHKESGLMLDIARHFYPPEVIKAFIDTIHQADGTFLHLHFSDHENYALESDILGQRVENAVNQNGIYINPLTNKPFLSYSQLNEIIDYAKARQIELIPELDSPNHMTAIFVLMEKKYGKDYVQSLKSQWNDEEIDITNQDSLAFMQSLIQEVIDIFGDSSKHFHIGGDEFGYSVESNPEFIRYANSLNAFLMNQKLITRMWNDGVINATLPLLDRNIEITYWSYDGDTQNRQDAEERRRIRASLPELIENGFNVLNYNSYYLYFNPKQGESTSYNSNYAMRDALQNWSLGIWDGQNRHNAVKESEQILGAALSIWGEEAGSLSADTIQKYTEELLNVVIRKTNVLDNSNNQTVQQLARLTDNNFVKLRQTTYIDLTQAENDALIQLENYHQTIRLLQVKQNVNKTVWIKGTHNHQLRLASFWINRDFSTTHQHKLFQLYEYSGNRLWVDKDIDVHQDK